MGDLGLLELSEAAGCACKADWDIVEAVRGVTGASPTELGLLDASVIPSRDGLCQVATVDFIGPIARDPGDYGVIASAHALSDLYAVGARPVFALAIAAWPRFEGSTEALRRAMEALSSDCARVGCLVAGGHTVISQQPLLGLSVVGEMVDAPRSTPRFTPGDDIYLTKPIGTGIVIGAVKEGHCPLEIEYEALDIMRRHNSVGLELNRQADIKIVTDVTGYGLCGQLSRLADATGLSVRIEAKSIPLIHGVADLVQSFRGTHAAERNFAILGSRMRGASWLHSIAMADPQTNGPLLFVCAAGFDPSCSVGGSAERPTFYRIGVLGERQPNEPIEVL